MQSYPSEQPPQYSPSQARFDPRQSHQWQGQSDSYNEKPELAQYGDFKPSSASYPAESTSTSRNGPNQYSAPNYPPHSGPTQFGSPEPHYGAYAAPSGPPPFARPYYEPQQSNNGSYYPSAQGNGIIDERDEQPNSSWHSKLHPRDPLDPPPASFARPLQIQPGTMLPFAPVVLRSKGHWLSDSFPMIFPCHELK